MEISCFCYINSLFTGKKTINLLKVVGTMCGYNI